VVEQTMVRPVGVVVLLNQIEPLPDPARIAGEPIVRLCAVTSGPIRTRL
jgi:hypothetical protein